MNDFTAALNLLTIFRLGNAPISGRALAYLPLVGLLIGVILSLAAFVLRSMLNPLVAAALVVVLWTIITGALHLDGFSDACDALFATTTRERRLEILHDVHLGAFGAAGLALLLIAKTAGTASVQTLAPVFLAPILGRWAMVIAAAFPLARKEGMAVMFHSGFSLRELFFATGLTAILCAVLGLFGLAAFITASVVAWSVARVAMNRLGGLTGDIYGMICESVEVAVLIVGGVIV